jgi:hypothetical protein
MWEAGLMNYNHLVNYLGRAIIISILVTMILRVFIGIHAFELALFLVFIGYAYLVIISNAIPTLVQKGIYVVLALPLISLGCLLVSGFQWLIALP